MTARVKALVGGPPPALAPRLLRLWIAVQVGAAAIALFVVATATSIQPGIALDWPGLGPNEAITAGLTFWLVFGLVGGIRTRLQPGGGVVTFSMPFIVAGTVLGGPLVGGLMGLVSEFEVRELRTKPWYGVLSNHAVGILAAVGSGIIALRCRSLLDQLLPGQDALAFFAVVMVAALVFATANVVLVIPTMALRNDLTIEEASRTPDVVFRVTTIAEAIVAWNLAMSYQLVGWWAPIAVVVLVLAVWQAFDRGEERRHDRLTGLLNDLGFAPVFEAAVRRASAGVRSGAFLSLDLDGLWEVNMVHGSGAGDEFLRASAHRMFGTVRATDAVCRNSGTGDEFQIFLDDVTTEEAARLVAERIRTAIREPIHIRGRDHAEMLHADVSIGIVLIEPGTTMTPTDIVDLGERRLLQAKVLNAGVVSTGDGPTDRGLEQHRAQKDERRRPGRP